MNRNDRRSIAWYTVLLKTTTDSLEPLRTKCYLSSPANLTVAESTEMATLLTKVAVYAENLRRSVAEADEHRPINRIKNKIREIRK